MSDELTCTYYLGSSIPATLYDAKRGVTYEAERLALETSDLGELELALEALWSALPEVRVELVTAA